jgi:hypothetical protein
MNSKDLEGGGRGVLEILPRHFSGWTEEIQENFNYDSRRPDLESNRAPLEYKLTALRLDKTVRWQMLLGLWNHGGWNGWDMQHAQKWKF